MKISLFAKTVVITSLALLPASATMGADHLEAPAVQADGSIDIADLFLFQNPNNANNSVMVLTVNPFAGSGNSGTTFNPNASYQFQFDNDGDAVADVTYATTFAAPVAGTQAYTVTRTSGGVSSVIATSTTDVAGSTVGTAAGGQVQAGLFDDPFFFDLNGFSNGLAFTGDDAFAGANVSAIVLDIPSSDFIGGSPNVGAQAVTELNGVRQDRIGRPAVATVLVPSGRKDEFNLGEPSNDFTDFGNDVSAVIESLSDAANATALTSILLPDLLTFDTSSNAGFLNGRKLTDDVIDAELTLLTASSTPIGDGVDANDVAFLDVFPYLARPSTSAVPEPGSATLLILLLVGGAARRSRRS